MRLALLASAGDAWELVKDGSDTTASPTDGRCEMRLGNVDLWSWAPKNCATVTSRKDGPMGSRCSQRSTAFLLSGQPRSDNS